MANAFMVSGRRLPAGQRLSRQSHTITTSEALYPYQSTQGQHRKSVERCFGERSLYCQKQYPRNHRQSGCFGLWLIFFAGNQRTSGFGPISQLMSRFRYTFTAIRYETKNQITEMISTIWKARRIFSFTGKTKLIRSTSPVIIPVDAINDRSWFQTGRKCRKSIRRPWSSRQQLTRLCCFM